MQKKNNRVLIKGSVCFVTQPELVHVFGRSAAVFLQQLHYWMTSDGNVGTIIDGQKWIYNSYAAWADHIQIFSQSTLRRVIKKLEGMGVVLSSNFNKKKSDQTKWYTLNYEVLENILKGEGTSGDNTTNFFPNDQPPEMSRPPVQKGHLIYKEPETTSENNFYSHASLELEEKEVIPDNTEDVTATMLRIWNEIVEQGKKTIELTQKRKRFLLTAFRSFFDGTLKNWETFCLRITSSKFLMGEIKTSFKASLDWVLKFDILQRIVEGDFGIGDRTSHSSVQSFEEEIGKGCVDERTQKLHFELLARFGKNVYVSWFKDLVIQSNEETICLQTPSDFVKDYLINRYGTEIQTCLAKIFPELKVVLT